jgi:WD40 repeat protein
VSKLAFDSHGRELLAATTDGAVLVWSLHNPSTIELRGHHGTVEDAAFSPDGQEVISGGADGTVRIWELAEAGKAVTIAARLGPITNVAFQGAGTEIEAVGTRGTRV